MELQHMITAIVEDTIEANFFDGVDTNHVNVPHETYEDTLAIANINSILVKYKDDLEDTDSKNKVSTEPPNYGPYHSNQESLYSIVIHGAISVESRIRSKYQ